MRARAALQLAALLLSALPALIPAAAADDLTGFRCENVCPLGTFGRPVNVVPELPGKCGSSAML